MMQHRFYMHENSMDICAEILNGHNDIYTIRWWNLGYNGSPFQVPSKSDERNQFQIKDTIKWHDITNLMFNKRYASGLPK